MGKNFPAVNYRDISRVAKILGFYFDERGARGRFLTDTASESKSNYRV